MSILGEIIQISRWVMEARIANIIQSWWISSPGVEFISSRYFEVQSEYFRRLKRNFVFDSSSFHLDYINFVEGMLTYFNEEASQQNFTNPVLEFC